MSIPSQKRPKICLYRRQAKWGKTNAPQVRGVGKIEQEWHVSLGGDGGIRTLVQNRDATSLLHA